MNKIILFFIFLYKKTSFIFPPCCIYTPTCSDYAICAFKRYNFWRAFRMTLFRILRCNPFFRGGFDPIK